MRALARDGKQESACGLRIVKKSPRLLFDVSRITDDTLGKFAIRLESPGHETRVDALLRAGKRGHLLRHYPHAHFGAKRHLAHMTNQSEAGHISRGMHNKSALMNHLNCRLVQ